MKHRNVQRFRSGLVVKAHRVCVSLNSRLESDKEKGRWRTGWGRGRVPETVSIPTCYRPGGTQEARSSMLSRACHIARPRRTPHVSRLRVEG